MLDIKEFPKHFCSVPWLQIHTEPNNKVYPCCYYDEDKPIGNWNDEKIVNIFNNDEWNKLRRAFLNGEKPEGCSKCWKEEDSGIMSMRQRFNERYSNFPDFLNKNSYNKFNDIISCSSNDGSVHNIKISTIDLIFNNICNCRCRTCGTKLSTAWIPDEIKLKRYEINPSTFLTNETIPHMREDLIALIDMIDPYTEIHFSGGEPMMQEEHYLFLKLLIDQKKTNVKIRYNTNLTVYELKEYNAFEMLKHFDNVFLVGSIDAIGKRGEYIRKGFDWEIGLNWIKTAKEYLPNADYGISAVYSLLNSYDAVDLHKFMCENELFKTPNGRPFGFYLNTLHNPPYLKTTLLPSEMKKEVSQKISDHIDYILKTQPDDFGRAVSVDHWKNAITYMNSMDESDSLVHFFHETNLLDDVRKEKFSEIFPDLNEKILKYWKK